MSAIINVQFSVFFSKSHPVKFLLGERRKPNDDKSTVVQVMAWCHQAASHYLSQCWSRSVSPYGDTKPSELSKGLSTDDDKFSNFQNCSHLNYLNFTFLHPIKLHSYFWGCQNTSAYLCVESLDSNPLCWGPRDQISSEPSQISWQFELHPVTSAQLSTEFLGIFCVCFSPKSKKNNIKTS